MSSTDSLPGKWQASSAHVVTPHDEVHVWAVPLEQSSSVVWSIAPRLSPVERSRADRFSFLADRSRYVTAHAAIREILGQYLQFAPAEVPLSVLPNGKPVLAPEVNGALLEFNWSHSHDLALIAITSGRRVGVDVEHIRSGIDENEMNTIAAHAFAPEEAAALHALPAHLHSRAFFRCWTGKEAYVKARGEGLRKPLKQFAVRVAPDQPAALLYDEADAHATSRWSLCSLDVGPMYAASLAVEGQDWHLRRWLWQADFLPS